jgi:small subunit ribosomal protein S1
MPAELSIPTEGETRSPGNQDMNSMAAMLEDYLSCRRLERGKIVSGVVVHVSSNEIIVDVGAKCEGIVPEQDLARLSPEDRAVICVGSSVLAYVMSTDDAGDEIILSLSRAQVAHAWQEAQQLFESQEVIESRVTDYNKGGVIVRVGKLRGFVPGSQLDAARTVKRQISTRLDQETQPEGSDGASAGSSSADRWAELVGQTLKLKVIEVDRERNRLILSEKIAVSEQRESRREKLLDELTEGDVRQGRVINLANFGAFVDIGGIDGLVHLSELSWKRVEHPREVMKVGQEVQVYVLGVDRERQRVALSVKRLQADPWDSIAERYQEGQLVEGIVTRLTKWGAFAKIVGDEAIEGLIHVSELDEGHVVHPREVIESGQVVTLRVINVDASRHRMALSLKQVAQGEYLEQDWEAMLATEQPELESPLSAAFSETSLAQAQEPSPEQG